MREKSPTSLSGCGNLEASRMCPTCRFSWTPHSLHRNQPFLENCWEINGAESWSQGGDTREAPRLGPLSWNSPGPSVALSLTQR